MAKESAGANNDTVMAAIATVPLIGLIMYFAMSDSSDFVKHYAKQGTGLFVIAIVITVLSFVLAFIPFIGWCASFLLWIGMFVAWLMLVINALQGKKYSLPVVTDLVNSVLK